MWSLNDWITFGISYVRIPKASYLRAVALHIWTRLWLAVCDSRMTLAHFALLLSLWRLAGAAMACGAAPRKPFCSILLLHHPPLHRSLHTHRWRYVPCTRHGAQLSATSLHLTFSLPLMPFNVPESSMNLWPLICSIPDEHTFFFHSFLHNTLINCGVYHLLPNSPLRNFHLSVRLFMNISYTLGKTQHTCRMVSVQITDCKRKYYSALLPRC